MTAYTEQQGLTYHNASSVLEDKAGNLWVGFWGGGINQIADGQIIPYTRQDGLSSDLVLTMHQNRAGELWVGLDYDGGLTLFRDTQFFHYREVQDLTDQAVKAIHEDSRGILWLGTRTALVAFNQGQFRRYTTREGLPSDTIEAIHEDRAGNLWFGTDGGLALLQKGKFRSFTTRDGLAHDCVTSICEDSDGTLWLGTRGGLSRLRNGTLAAFTSRDGLFQEQIQALAEDDLGCLWMASRQGIIRVSKFDLDRHVYGGIEKVACVSFGRRDGMASVECKGLGKTAAWKSRDGRLWFTTSKGVVAVNPQAARVNSVPPRVVLEDLLIDGKPASLSEAVHLVAAQQELVFRYTALNFSAPEKIPSITSSKVWIKTGPRPAACVRPATKPCHRARTASASSPPTVTAFGTAKAAPWS